MKVSHRITRLAAAGLIAGALAAPAASARPPRPTRRSTFRRAGRSSKPPPRPSCKASTTASTGPPPPSAPEPPAASSCSSALAEPPTGTATSTYRRRALDATPLARSRGRHCPPSRRRPRRRAATPDLPGCDLSPFLSPRRFKRCCRAKAQRNLNPRVGGSSPSSGMRSGCKSTLLVSATVARVAGTSDVDSDRPQGSRPSSSRPSVSPSSDPIQERVGRRLAVLDQSFEAVPARAAIVRPGGRGSWVGALRRFCVDPASGQRAALEHGDDRFGRSCLAIQC